MVKCNGNKFSLINEVTFDAHRYDSTYHSHISYSFPTFSLLLLSCVAAIVNKGEQPPLLLLLTIEEKMGVKEKK